MKKSAFLVQQVQNRGLREQLRCDMLRQVSRLPRSQIGSIGCPQNNERLGNSEQRTNNRSIAKGAEMATQRKMARTQGAWKRQEWHGFAFEIGPDTDLQGDGLLILERPDGSYEPVAN